MELAKEVTAANLPMYWDEKNPLAPYRCVRCHGQGRLLGIVCEKCKGRGRLKRCPVCFIQSSPDCKRCKGVGEIPD